MAFKQPQRGATAGAARYTYKPRSADTTLGRLDNYKSGSKDSYLAGDVNTFSPKEGDNWVRFLPPTWPEADHYALDLWVHYEVGPDNNSYLCVEQMAEDMARYGYPIQVCGEGPIVCPLCEELRRAQKAGQSEYGRALEAGHRLVAWILNREEQAKGVVAWQYPKTIDREVLEQSHDRRTGEILQVDNPDEGYDVEFSRQGKGLKTRYTGFKLARKADAVDAKYVDFVVENPLPKLLIFYDAAHIMTAFAGPMAVQTATPATKATMSRQQGVDENEPPHEPDAGSVAGTRATTGTRAASTPTTGTPASTGGAVTPATPAAATPGASRRQRLATKPAPPLVPDFASMDINAQLDWAAEHNITVPDEIPDESVAAFLAEQAAAAT